MAHSEPEGFRINVRSLFRWWREYNRLGDDGQIKGLAALVDRYGRDNDGPAATRSPEAQALFYDLYRTENKVGAAACHEVVRHEARRRGWTWPTSYQATMAWLDKYDDRNLTYLLRNGKGAWAHKYLPHLQISYEKISAGWMFQGDHVRP